MDIKLSLLVVLVFVISLIYTSENSTSSFSRSERSANRAKKLFPNNNRISSCRKYDFHVKFFELGWDKWIIYPKVFNAHICSGNCALPLRMNRKRKHNSLSSPSLVQITNHAQIMSILEFKHPEINKQMTKCVPTKLKPLTVIYLNENGQIKTKQYEDMIVQECGCR